MKRFVFAMTAVVVLSGIGMCQSEAKRRPQDPSPEDLARIRAAVPNKATARPAKPRKMLVLSYQSHERGRFAGEKMLAIMAEKTGAFEITLVEDKETMARIMVPEELKAFDAVCLNNSTGGEGNAVNGKTFVENLSDYVAGGGGLVGIHAATDNKMGEVFGGFFSGHPWRERDPAVGVKIDDPHHTLTKVFAGEGFMVNDEIYQFTKIYSRENLRILLSLDMNKTKNIGQREDNDYAVAWVRAHGNGRVFYCSLGHKPQIFQDPKLMQFYLDGIQFALGDIKADMTPSGTLPRVAERQFRRLPVAEYRDKMKGAWLGQMIGVGWGDPTEFKFKCIIPEDMMPQWKPEMVNQHDNDDLYVELTFLRTLEQYGMDVSIRQAGIDFARSGYKLWHANDAGRNNLRRGIAPPDSGHPKFNGHVDDIDYQIEADYSGIIAPGLPNTAIELGDKFGRLMNYGDGLYGGQFVGGMYAEAFFHSDPWKIVEAGLKCIPPDSQYAEMVRDLLRWCKENTDWTKTWQLVEEKYHKDPRYTHGLCSKPGAGSTDPKLQIPGSARGGGSIDAKLNGAYIIMGLLYGQGDLDKTIVISCRCGQDSDCNPSNAGGVLCTMIGASKIPSRFTEKLDLTAQFSFSDYTLPQVYDLSEKLARQAVIRAGGRIEKDAKGEEIFVIPVQTPKPSALERSWQPGPIANSKFTDEEMAMIKGDQGVTGVGRQFPPEWTTYADPVTDVEITVLTTSTAKDEKIYQTYPSWTADLQHIVFMSDRTGSTQFFAISTETGIITQLTEDNLPRAACLNPTKNQMFYIVGTEIWELDIDAVTRMGLDGPQNTFRRKVATLPDDVHLGSISLDSNSKDIYVPVRRDNSWSLWSLNAEHGDLRKIIDLEFQGGHFQAHPSISGLIMYCWETGGDSEQRMWIVRADGSGNEPFYKETYNEWVTHEAWWGSTVKALFVIWPKNDEMLKKPHGVAYISLQDRSLRILSQEKKFWHVAGDSSGGWAVADTMAGEIYLLDGKTGHAKLLTQGHRPNGATVHSHPSFSPDGSCVLFGSEKQGNWDLCLIRLR